MVLYDYQNATAFDPYTRQGEPNALGSVYDLADSAFASPLTVVLMGSGLQTNELTSDEFCQLPGFQVEDRKQVLFKSGSFTKVLNTTTPLVGPAGPAITEAVDNGDDTVTFLLENGAQAATIPLPASKIPGPPGDKGETGPKGDPGVNAVPAADAVATYATTPGNPVNTALTATTGQAVKAAVGARRPVAQKAHYNTATPYAGTETSATYKMNYPVKVAAENLALIYANAGGSKEANTVGTLTLKVSVAAADGVRIPVTFAGERTVTWKPGDALKSDMISKSWAAGDVLTVYTNVTATGSPKWPLGRAMYPNEGEGVIYGQDYTDAGTVPTVFTFGLGPQAVEGTAFANNLASVALVGDSIMTGQGDTPTYMGFAARALAGSVPYTQVSLPGDTAVNYVAKHDTRRIAYQGATHAITNYGTNDRANNRTADQIKADLLAIWNEQVADGIKPYALTIPPRTTSTDSWATTTNQTPIQNEAARVTVNDWIRTTPAPLAGYFDVADAWESARNSGVWKVGQTGDGVHPNAAGHLTGAAVIDPTVFTFAPGKVKEKAVVAAAAAPAPTTAKAQRYAATITGGTVTSTALTWADTGAKTFTEDRILNVEFNGMLYQGNGQSWATLDIRMMIGGVEARIVRRTYPAVTTDTWVSATVTASKLITAGSAADVKVTAVLYQGTGSLVANASGNYNGLSVVAVPA